MTALLYSLLRHRDPSNVSGTGTVATIVEFDDGQAVLHWDSETPSTTVYTDFRHIEELHGHEGASELVLYDSSRAERLLSAYQRVVPWMLSARYHDRPIMCAPHPDLPDRLRLTFVSEKAWRFWIALLDGSTDAAIQEDIGGETEHRWTSPDGDLWLVFHARHSSKYPDNSPYDDRD